MVRLSNAKQIFDLDDVVTRDVEVPEWVIDGETVTVTLRALTGTARDQYESSMTRVVRGKNGQREVVPDYVNARSRLVALSAIDETGALIFPGTEAVLKLGMKNALALDRLWRAACELSGIDFDGTGAAEKDDAEGFEDAPEESSTSG